MLDQEKNLYLISLRILTISFLDKEGILLGDLTHDNHSWELKG